MIKINELRTGNYLHYIDVEQEYPMPCKIDWQDLKWLEEKPNSFNECHKPIPLTIDLIENIGFEPDEMTEEYTGKKAFKNSLATIAEDGEFYNGIYSQKVKYLHQLQNLYFALFNQELEIKATVAAIA